MKRVQTRSEGAKALVAKEKFSDRPLGSFVRRCGLMTICVCLTMLLGMRTAAAQAADEYIIYQAEKLSGTTATFTEVEMFFHDMSNAVTYEIVAKTAEIEITSAATGSLAAADGSIVFQVKKAAGGVLEAGTYEFGITMTGDGCPSGEQTFKLIILGKPVLDPFAGNTPICNGANNLSLTGKIIAADATVVKYTWVAVLETTGLTEVEKAKVTFVSSGAEVTAVNGDVSVGGTITNELNKSIEIAYTVTPIAYFDSHDNTIVTGESKTVKVVVQPTAILTSLDTIVAVCNKNAISYIPTSNVAGATFAWSRAAVEGIEGGAATGTGIIAESLTNTTDAPIKVTYVYTVTANACENAATYPVTVVVNPTLTLSSNLKIGDFCSGVAITYTPVSFSKHVNYTWSRPAIVGIEEAAKTDVIGNITNDILTNTTNAPITVVYEYTLTAYGCENVQNVTAVVQPTLDLKLSKVTDTICSGATTDVDVTTTLTGGVNKVKWTATAAGGNISGYSAMAEAEYTAGLKIAQTLVNTGTTEGTVTYTVTQSFGNCPTTKTYVVTVAPKLIIEVVAEQVICSEDATETVTFKSNVTSPVVSYAWEFTFNPNELTVESTAVTITSVDGTTSKASGTGVFTVEKVTRADNATTAVKVNVTVTGTLTGTDCSETTNFDVTVKPKPKFKLGKKN